MSVHEDIVINIQTQIAALGNCSVISPTALASRVMRSYQKEADQKLDVHIEYTSLEHFKQLCRKQLANRFTDEGEENPVYDGDQGELFSGHLQERYPLPRPKGVEPQYKRRELLTAEERAWNVRQLRKAADSRMAHADALEAEGRGQIKDTAA